MQTETISAPLPVSTPRAPGIDGASPKLYLVGERERSNPRPSAVTDGRTMVRVNGRWHGFRGATLAYEQIVAVVTARPGDHGAVFGRTISTGATVSFRRGAAAMPSGLLAPGDAVPLVEGMLFSVAVTQAS